MYIDETMRAAKEELALECDYTNEALAQKKFKKLAEGDPAFYIPQVIDALSTKRILTTERIYGVAIDRLATASPGASSASAASAPSVAHGQEKIFVSESVRNSICTSLLRLCLNELFQYRFMQTDPNWSNFLYNPNNNLLYLIDFGASRLYRKQFVDEYLRMVYACSIRDRQGIIESNIKLGFLTGDESKEMIEATVQAGPNRTDAARRGEARSRPPHCRAAM
jgi:aarF domain-containing kinase